METDKMKILIDAFYEGKTTLEEEQELYRYFLREDIPLEFEGERQIFLEMYGEGSDEIELPEGFSLRLENLIDDLGQKEKSKKKITLHRRLTGIAASLALLVSIGLYTHSQHNNSTLFVDTFNNPEEAYIEAQQTLELMSLKMNQGFNQLEIVENDISKANNILINKLD